MEKFKNLGDSGRGSKNMETLQCYSKLLENFVFLRITSLLTSIEDVEELIEEYFRLCLEVPKHDHSIHIRNSFEQLLLMLVEDCDELTPSIMEILLSPFKPLSSNLKAKSCAYEISSKVFKLQSDRLQLCMYRVSI